MLNANVNMLINNNVNVIPETVLFDNPFLLIQNSLI